MDTDTNIDVQEAERQAYHDQISKEIVPILQKFDNTIKSYVAFNMIFLAVGVVEVLLFFLFFTFLAKSSVLAITLAILFLSLFSYFVLRLYLQTKKPEQLSELREEFLSNCKALIHYQEGRMEHHSAIANASCRFAATLHDREYHYYTMPAWLDILGPSIEHFSCWWHWEDIFKMKELFLVNCVEEHIKLVKCEPTNLEIHAGLANAYVLLSSLYADPRNYEGGDEDRWLPPQRYSEEMQRKFRLTAAKAIEEFKILNDYAPDDPWVHAQLAYSYHDLQMPEEEIREYETILRLRPDDNETLFKLGMLYFQQGKNAKGLQIYENLKHSHYSKAESLIKFYGVSI